MENILILNNKEEFRNWLIENHNIKKECWIKNLKRGKPVDDNIFYYIDAVYEALCFGWIDSVYKKVDGELYQRFSPRKKDSNWTVLNMVRCKYLIDNNKMTNDGLRYLPKEKYKFDEKIIQDIKDANIYDLFIKCPYLYQQIKVSNMASIRSNSEELYQKSLQSLIKKTKENKLSNEYNDYGRLEKYSL